jgi:hypothetical protein
MNELVPKSRSRTVASVASTIAVPAVVAAAGDQAARRFLEFFAATIRNRDTRMAYYRAVCSFFVWVDTKAPAMLFRRRVRLLDEMGHNLSDE